MKEVTDCFRSAQHELAGSLRFRQWNAVYGKYQEWTGEATGWERAGQRRAQTVRAAVFGLRAVFTLDEDWE